MFNIDTKEYCSLLPKNKTIINWWDLYSGHYLTLKKNFQKTLFAKAICKSGNFSEVANALGISRRTIAECYKCRRNPTIGTLKLVMQYLGMNLSSVNKFIVEIAGLKPKLPFVVHNEAGSEIRAAFLSDGHIPKELTANPMYCANEPELHDRLIRLCKCVFGKFYAQTVQGHKSLLTRFPAPLGVALELAGVPRGDKRNIVCFVPKDIFTGPQSCKIAYLRRVFDDEGDVCFDKFGKRAVRITRSCGADIKLDKQITIQKWTSCKKSNMPCNMLLIGEFLLLKEMGINAKMYSEGIYKSLKDNLTAKWRVQVGQQDDLKLFSEKIGFNYEPKAQKLKLVLNSYKIHKSSNGFMKNLLYESFIKNSKTDRIIRFSDFGKKLVNLGKTYDLAGRYINIFLKDGLLEKVGHGEYSVK